MNNKTCGDCKYHCKSGNFCSHHGIPWLTESNGACKDFEPIPKQTNRERINTVSDRRLANLFTYQTEGGAWTSSFITYVCKDRKMAVSATEQWLKQEVEE
jgi:hypothetical protein